MIACEKLVLKTTHEILVAANSSHDKSYIFPSARVYKRREEVIREEGKREEVIREEVIREEKWIKKRRGYKKRGYTRRV